MNIWFRSVATASLVGTILLTAEPIPPDSRAFLQERCLQCHSGDQPQAEVQLDLDEITREAKPAPALWERVYNALARNEMPPRGAGQPPEDERERMVAWLDGQLMKHSGVGGAVPRRLNRQEYENTVRDLFDLPEFQLPDAFPADGSSHGFDNVGEGLILSPPLMAQYLEVATLVADAVLPPDRGPVVVESRHYPIGVGGLGTSEGGKLAGDRYRLVSSRNMASAAAWPARFEAGQSGVYRLVVDVATFQTDKMIYERRSAPLRMSVYARPKTEQVYAPFGDIREVARFDVDPNRDSPQKLTVEIELVKGEIFGLRWKNGPASSDPPKRDYSRTFLADRLKRDRLYYAAMLSYGGGPRGATQEQVYDATVALMKSGNLDLTDARLDSMPEVWGGGLSNAPHNWIKAFVQEELYRFGPALDLIDVQIEGPQRLIEDDAMRAQAARKRRFLGDRGPGMTDREYTDAILRRFLSKVFRRPASDERIAAYTKLVQSSSGLEPGLHLAIRRALVSPNFLYRGLRPGLLDDFDLASRLSCFLTSAPPEPPADIPAIAPDTSNAATLRDQLNRHRTDPSCASCHKRIDPLGMVMENFDPVGRWRDNYPRYIKPSDGAEAL